MHSKQEDNGHIIEHPFNMQTKYNLRIVIPLCYITSTDKYRGFLSKTAIHLL